MVGNDAKHAKVEARDNKSRIYFIYFFTGVHDQVYFTMLSNKMTVEGCVECGQRAEWMGVKKPFSSDYNE